MTVQRIVGIGDLACDTAAGFRDVRAVAGGVQGVVVAGEEGTVVRGLPAVGQRGGDEAAGGLASPERLSEALALCAIHKPAALYDSHCLKVFLFLALKAEKAVVL